MSVTNVTMTARSLYLPLYLAGRRDWRLVWRQWWWIRCLYLPGINSGRWASRPVNATDRAVSYHLHISYIKYSYVFCDW